LASVPSSGGKHMYYVFKMNGRLAKSKQTMLLLLIVGLVIHYRMCSFISTVWTGTKSIRLLVRLKLDTSIIDLGHKRLLRAVSF
jgi:hypothetical protein